jgi:hypothetical protein
VELERAERNGFVVVLGLAPKRPYVHRKLWIINR